MHKNNLTIWIPFFIFDEKASHSNPGKTRQGMTRHSKATPGEARRGKTRRRPDLKVSPGFEKYCRYAMFYNPSLPRMFFSLDLLSEYGILHGAIGPLYLTFSYSIWIFCRGVSGFATDCPCGDWCRGLTTCPLHVGQPFGNRFLNNSRAVCLT